MRFWVVLTLACGVVAGLGAPVVRGADREAAPERLVSLAPSLTGMLEALDVGGHLVGVSMHCPVPEGARSVGRIDVPDYETLLALRPDLVLATHLTPAETIARLEAMGLRTERFRHEGLGGVLADIERLAEVVGVPERGAALAGGLRERWDAVTASVAADSADRPRALLLYSIDGRFSAGRGTFPGDMIIAAGGMNVAADAGSPWPRLEKESILVADPEVMFLSAGGCLPDGGTREEALALLRADRFWRHVSAVKTGRVYLFEGAVLSVPGPRSFDALEQMHAQLKGTEDLTDDH